MVMKNLIAAVALLAVGANADAGFKVAKFEDADCKQGSPEQTIVASGALADLLSGGDNNDGDCFTMGPKSGQENSMGLSAGVDGNGNPTNDGQCRLRVYETHACGATAPMNEDWTLDICMSLPEDAGGGFGSVKCFGDLQDGGDAGESGENRDKTIDKQVESIEGLLQPEQLAKVVGAIKAAGPVPGPEGMKAWAKAIAKTLGVEADSIELKASNLPLSGRRHLLEEDQTLYMTYTATVDSPEAAAAMAADITDNGDDLVAKLSKNLEEEGVDPPEIIIEPAMATEGICTNICTPDTYVTPKGPDYWKIKKDDLPPVYSPLGPALFGLPRKVPTDGMADYEGAFDVTNTDYLASVAFVGVVGFGMAILSLVCLILGLLWSIIKPCCCCCKGNKDAPPPAELTGSKKYLPMVFIVGFTCMVASGSFMVYGGGPKVASGMAGLFDVMKDAVATITLHAEIIVNSMKAAVKAMPELAELEEQADMIDVAVKTVNAMIEENEESIGGYIETAQLMFMILAAAFMGMAILASASALLGWGVMLSIFKFLAHIFTVFGWIMFGIAMAVSVVMNDLCVSLEEYLESPATSALDAVMPCLSPSACVDMMNELRGGVNEAITVIQGPGTAFNSLISFQSRMFGNCNLLCNPYLSKTTEDVCAADESTFKMYEEKVCEALYKVADLPDDADGNPGVPWLASTIVYPVDECIECCTPLHSFTAVFMEGEPPLLNVPEEAGIALQNGVAAADALRTASPPIESLLSCEFVLDAFDQMVSGDTCAGLVGGLELFVIGMGFVCSGYVLLWITWNVLSSHITKANERKKALKKGGANVEVY